MIYDPSIEVTWLGGNCPVQAEGYIGTEKFYFRARWDKWYFGVGKEPVMSASWTKTSPYGDSPAAAGWMPIEEAIVIVADCIAEYVKWSKESANKTE